MGLNQSELIDLRKQYQDTIEYHEECLWKQLRFIISLIAALITVQSGLIIYFLSRESLNKLSLLIIPVGLFFLCFIGFLIERYIYQDLLKHLSCLKKIDDAIDYKRPTKKSFLPDEKIFLFHDSFKVDNNIKTDKDYIKYNSKILKWNNSIFDIVKLIYLLLISIPIILLIIVYSI